MSGPGMVALAKDRLTIPALWEMRGWPGKPGKSCRFPDGSDRRASASVFADGQLIKDFRSGDLLDAPALLARVENTSEADACRLFLRLAGVTGADAAAPLPPPPAPRVPAEPVRVRPSFPALECGTAADVAALAKLRGVSPAAVSLAMDRGLLHFADSREGRAWLVADSARWNFIARRLDGRGWRCLGDKKARMPRGGWAAWPIGIADAAPFPALAIVEGGPDALAAFHFAHAAGVADRVAVLVMASAGMTIPAQCLDGLEGKRARIFMDADKWGAAAFERWAGQLAGAGVTVDGFSFDGLTRADGEPVKDLCDALQLSEESRARWGQLVAGCMDFAREAGPAHCVSADDPAGRILARLPAPQRQLVAGTEFARDEGFLAAVEMFVLPGGEICPA